MQSRTTFDYRKTEAVSNRGMAAAMHPLAAEAGAADSHVETSCDIVAVTVEDRRKFVEARVLAVAQGRPRLAEEAAERRTFAAQGT